MSSFAVRSVIWLAVCGVAIGLIARNASVVVLAAVPCLIGLLALAAGRAGEQVRATLTIRPHRVSVGETASLLIAASAGRHRRAHVAWCPVGTTHLAVPLPAIGPDAPVTVEIPVSAQRRGRHVVGPLQVGIGDPFGLVAQGRGAGAATSFVVHPTIHAIPSFPVGQLRDQDGPTSAASPEGGIAFHSLREYVPGDDLRLISWKASARTGELFVRQNVDPHLPVGVVVLDQRATSYGSAADLDQAVESAASLIAAAAANHAPVELWTNDGEVSRLVGLRDGHEWGLLDIVADATPSPTTMTIADLLAASTPTEASATVVVLTGDVPSIEGELAGILSPLERYPLAVLARFGRRSMTGQRLGRTQLLVCDSSSDFAGRWSSERA